MKIIENLANNIESNFYDKSENLYYDSYDNLTNKYSYLWAMGALFQAYDEMEEINSLKNALLLDKVFSSINQYYDGTKNITSKNYGGYDSYVVKFGGGSRYYDDNEWVGLALADAYNITKNTTFLNGAEKIFDFIKNGYDDKLGGGIYWMEGGNSKNTCSNGPAIVLSLKLYQITHKATYLEFAQKVYKWLNATLLSPQGVYWDHIDLNGHIGKDTFTYNTGIMIQANVLFYEITNDSTYLQEAKTLAQTSLNYFAPNGEFPYWDDGSFWFNAVLLRGYQSLYEVDKNDGAKYIDVFSKWAKNIWEQKGKALETQSLLYQAAMLEIYSRLYQL